MGVTDGLSEINSLMMIIHCNISLVGAPVGSLLCGSKDFITSARRIRKVLGGDMRQVGILAAAGLVALENIPKLVHDHKRAYAFASALNELQSSIFSIDLSIVHTNMVFVNIESDTIDATKFIHCLLEFDDAENEHVVVKCLALSDSLIRTSDRAAGENTRRMLANGEVQRGRVRQFSLEKLMELAKEDKVIDTPNE